MKTQTIHVEVREGYDVFIGGGLLDRCGQRLWEILGPCRLALVTDQTVEGLYLAPAARSLRAAGFDLSCFSFPPGEQAKEMVTLAKILEFLAENRITRADCVIALGGGVTGDLAGFAAGCYLRGVRFVQLPTTLLAAVDSSVGGKTGVNLRAGKNLAGLFHQPSAVLCDTDCLGTLPDGVFSEGVAEAIKTGILGDPALFSILESEDVRANLDGIIARCVAFKGAVVAADELETGPRRTLNLGHTVGHAVEKLSGYAIPHGRAVAMGIAVITRAAARLGYCTADCAARVQGALTRNGLPIRAPFGAGELAGAALADKKRAGDEITLVFPRKIGDCFLKKIPVTELAGIIRAGAEVWT